MMYPKGFARRWGMPLVLLATLATLFLTACGTQGNPPALNKSVQVTLRASGGDNSLGQATLTPSYGAHVIIYMHGALLPFENPQTPAQLRQGGCYGPVVAPLTSNAPVAGSHAVVGRDATSGTNIARPLDQNWYVVVLKSAASDAPVVACGHPLSTRRQYFDLYEPDKVDQGIGLGIALFEGIVITQVRVSLTTPTATQPSEWSIHSGGCQGSTLASGSITPGSATGSGIAFAPLDMKSWWLSVVVNGASKQTTCVKAG